MSTELALGRVGSGKGRFAQVSSFVLSANHMQRFPGKCVPPTLSPLVIYAVAVGRLEQNNLPWLTDGEERNGRNHYFPVKISLKQSRAELCMLRGVFGPLINSRGPISPSKAFLIISPVEKAALNAVEMILQEHVCLCLGDLQAFCRIILLKSLEIH